MSVQHSLAASSFGLQHAVAMTCTRGIQFMDGLGYFIKACDTWILQTSQRGLQFGCVSGLQPQRLWGLSLWKHSEPIWARSWSTCCRSLCLSMSWTSWLPKVPPNSLHVTLGFRHLHQKQEKGAGSGKGRHAGEPHTKLALLCLS